MPAASSRSKRAPPWISSSTSSNPFATGGAVTVKGTNSHFTAVDSTFDDNAVFATATSNYRDLYGGALHVSEHGLATLLRTNLTSNRQC